MRDDVTEFTKLCDTCVKRKTGHRATASLGEALEARGNFWTWSLWMLWDHCLLLREEINICLRLLTTLSPSAKQSL
jgi:hypothetical protein